MKKLYIMLIALIVALAMILPSALPVMAKDPQDNKPVAWVSWSGSNGPAKDEMGEHIHVSILVKLLKDGTISGYVKTNNFTYEQVVSWPIEDVRFLQYDDFKVADILVTNIDEFGQTWYFCFRLMDGGEPGNQKDLQILYIFFIGWPPTQGYPSSWPPFDQPYDPFAYWPNLWWPWASQGGQDIGDPNFGVPWPIASSNIQIHITDEYVP